MKQADLDRNEIIDKDEVLKMARQAGLLVIGTAEGGEAVYTWPAGITEEIESFAKLVADAATAKEREACAKVCDDWAKTSYLSEAKSCAKIIRARRDEVTYGETALRGEAT